MVQICTRFSYSDGLKVKEENNEIKWISITFMQHPRKTTLTIAIIIIITAVYSNNFYTPQNNFRRVNSERDCLSLSAS